MKMGWPGLGTRRGTSLGVVIVALTAVIFLVFLSLSTGLQQLSLAAQLDGRARARDAAESLLHQAIAELCRDPKWGQDRSLAAVLRLAPEDCPRDGGAVLAFHPTVARDEKVKYSTNNLETKSSAPGYDRTVPRDACHLVALGRCGSHQLQVETMFFLPPFPVGCASSGPVRLNAVRIWGHPSDTVPTLPLGPNPAEAAHVFSNSPQTESPALSLGPGCDIQGNAGAVGRVQLSEGAVVRGEVRGGVQPGVVPHFDISAIWNQLSVYVGLIAYVPNTPLEMFCVVDHSLNIPGNLELRGGTLAVHGDLSIGGELLGQGLVVATGNVTAQAGSDFQGLRKTALLAGGNVTLSGLDKSYIFNGLVYAQGSIEAHDLTVLGSLICDGKTGEESVRLERVDMIQSPVAVEGVMTLPEALPSMAGSVAENSVLINLHSYPDPTNPKRRLGMGSAVYSDDAVKRGDLWPRGKDDIHGVVWAPPKVYFKEGRGFSAQGNPQWDESKTRVQAFDGNIDTLRAQMKTLMNVHRHFDERGQDEFRKFVNDRLDALTQTTASTGVIRFDVSKLVPAVDRVRILTWNESAPLR